MHSIVAGMALFVEKIFCRFIKKMGLLRPKTQILSQSTCHEMKHPDLSKVLNNVFEDRQLFAFSL